MTHAIDAQRLEQRRRATVRARSRSDKQGYFRNVAEARHVLRKAFRIIEEHARAAGIDPLAHQALIQIYGSEENRLRVKDLADRLDISQAFTSSLVGALAERGLVSRTRGAGDQRETLVSVTEAAIDLLTAIDTAVQADVDAFTAGLSPGEKESALSILMFYVGMKIGPAEGKAR